MLGFDLGKAFMLVRNRSSRRYSLMILTGFALQVGEVVDLHWLLAAGALDPLRVEGRHLLARN